MIFIKISIYWQIILININAWLLCLQQSNQYIEVVIFAFLYNLCKYILLNKKNSLRYSNYLFYTFMSLLIYSFLKHVNYSFFFFRIKLVRDIYFNVSRLYGGFIIIVAEGIKKQPPRTPTAMAVWYGYYHCIFDALVHLAALWILYLCKLLFSWK